MWQQHDQQKRNIGNFCFMRMWKRGCIKMTIEWLAGNRLRGTTAERPALGLASPSVGGWKELGRTTLGSANSSLSNLGFADKRYYMILIDEHGQSGASTNNFFRAGSSGSLDTGSNYAGRHNSNGTGDGTVTSATSMICPISAANGVFHVQYAANLSGKEKLFMGWKNDIITAGAGGVPYRKEFAWKHVQTANPLDSFELNTGGGDTFNSGSEIVVLGWDPADTHTTNFWEELASVEYSGGTALTSGTITAKKYLWVQAYLKIASGTVDSNLWRFNADTGNNYAARYSRDGATDGANASISHMNINFGAGTRNNQLINMFIINNSANEKLVTGSGVSQGASTSGTAPNRLEFAPKWANTTDQITSIQCTQGNSLNFEAGTIMKVWGSD